MWKYCKMTQTAKLVAEGNLRWKLTEPSDGVFIIRGVKLNWGALRLALLMVE